MVVDWSQVLDRHAWNVHILFDGFWIADGYDTFVLLTTERPTLRDILPPGEYVMFRISAFERNLVPLACKILNTPGSSLESCQLIGRF
jgi:hypothetical protein